MKDVSSCFNLWWNLSKYGRAALTVLLRIQRLTHQLSVSSDLAVTQLQMQKSSEQAPKTLKQFAHVRTNPDDLHVSMQMCDVAEWFSTCRLPRTVRSWCDARWWNVWRVPLITGCMCDWQLAVVFDAQGRGASWFYVVESENLSFT